MCVALIRLRLADVPLERDEGEYAYAGQLILQGIPPYQLAYNMKFPGIYYAYSAILALFGDTPWGIHVGLLVLNAATVVVLFALGRHVVGATAALVAAVAFAVLSLDWGLMGIFGHATHFVVLPVLAALLVLVRVRTSGSRRALFGAGTLLGTAVLMKQHAIFFLPLAMTLVTDHERPGADRRRAPIGRHALLLGGLSMPFLLVCAVLAAQGVLARFWFWTFQYASQYATETSLSEAWANLVLYSPIVMQPTWTLWALGALGVAALWLAEWSRETRMFLTVLLIVSFLAMCPGLHFKEHYFIMLLPAVALFVGVAIASIERSAGRTVAVAVFVVAVSTYVITQRHYLFSIGPREVSRARYGANPFLEAPDIARYIRGKTTPGQSIAVVGSEPEIYFYARRPSATGYIYTYGLMEPQPYAFRMQQEMMDEIEAANPAYLVYVSVATSWSPRPDSNRAIFEWLQRYTDACYDLAGIADIAMDTTIMRWDGDATGYKPQSPYVVETFRRKSDGHCSVARAGS